MIEMKCFRHTKPKHRYILPCSTVPTSITTAAPVPTTTAAAPVPTTTAPAPVPTTIVAPVAAGVTVALLLLCIVLIAVMFGFLWVKRQRRMKAADRNIPLEIMSW